MATGMLIHNNRIAYPARDIPLHLPGLLKESFPVQAVLEVAPAMDIGLNVLLHFLRFSHFLVFRVHSFLPPFFSTSFFPFLVHLRDPSLSNGLYVSIILLLWYTFTYIPRYNLLYHPSCCEFIFYIYLDILMVLVVLHSVCVTYPPSSSHSLQSHIYGYQSIALRTYSHYNRHHDPRRRSYHEDMDVDPDIDLASKSRQPFQHQRNDDVPNGHSFRSFRSQHQYRPNTSYPSQPQHSHSFSGGGGMFRFNVPDSNGFAQREREYDSSLNTSRPSTANTARPGTSTRPSTATTLPPLKSVLPSSVAPLPPPSRARPGSNAGFSGRPLSSASPGGSFSGYGNSLPPLGHNGTSLPTLSSSRSTNGLRLPPPTPSGFDFRPGSRSGSSQGSYVYRPGTAPAMGPGAVYPGSSMGYGWEDDRSNGDSPFSFNAPPLSSSGSRKRGFSAVDEGDGERTSESRPQSRRLSVMELCAPDSISGRPESSSGSPKTGGILFTPIREPYSSATSGSRPGTSGTGLIVRGAAGLDLGDRENGSAQSVPKSYELFARAAPAAGGSITKNKRESPNATVYATAAQTISTKSTSPGPTATIPSPLSAHAIRPTTSDSRRSIGSPHSPIESERQGYGYSHHARHRSGSGYRQPGAVGGGSGSGYGAPFSSSGKYSSEYGFPAGSPGSDAPASPATSTRSPLSAGSVSPPSAVSAASVHAWR
ncbi:hypothetical protein F5878DRAFT_208141 [Lentinula raphanica]|uniref:Uncharacterized protein n=1 Tax=Lentinula raphanica TaxID=153919 RepID=A0AA38PJ71_9AGAR|nr:hypothetical protein F5878DRAFT_208141 [Lentinula raphanica]